ncbi:MAG: hypothetical protein K2L80_03120 [Muribaculaceae bacterium]|nr:hypothetical protein [Muribaculaceae bacterium]
MKLLKYMSFALLATAAAGCSEDAPDPNAIDPGSFFPSYGDVAFQKCAPNPDEGVYDNTFNIQICRTSNTVGETVRLAYSVKVYDALSDSYVDGPKNLFTVPEQFTYTTSAPMGYIPVVAHNELMELHEPIMLTVTILDDTAYGANTIEVEYQRVYPEESWTHVGTCNVVDGWVFPIFGLDGFDYSFDCSFEVNDADPLLYRLVNPYQSPMFYEGLRSYNIAPAGGRYYWQIDLNNPEIPTILPSVSGFEFRPDVLALGMLTICNGEGYCVEKGYDPEEEIAPEERSTFKDNVISVNTCFFFDGTGVGPYNNGGKGQISFPPYVEINQTPAGTPQAKIAPAGIGQSNGKLAVQYFNKTLNVKI